MFDRWSPIRAMSVTLFLMIPGLISCGDADRTTGKRIALSFDDAPKDDGPIFSGDERGVRLIEALDAAGTGPAVFFVTTSHFDLPGGKERVTRYADAGHLIANHSHSHLWLKQTDTDKYIDDIDTAEELLEGFDNRRPWFRFPFLDKGRAVDIEALRGVCVEVLLEGVSFYERVANESLRTPPAHVLLLHENDVAAMFIGDLISAQRGQGWSIVSPDEAYADPIARSVPDTLLTNQGHVAALAIDAGLDNRTLTHLAIEEDQIDALLQERDVFGEAN